jgi:hypothetical protein
LSDRGSDGFRDPDRTHRCCDEHVNGKTGKSLNTCARTILIDLELMPELCEAAHVARKLASSSTAIF